MAEKKIVLKARALRRWYRFQQIFNGMLCVGTVLFFAWCFNRHNHSFWKTNNVIERAQVVDQSIQSLSQEIAQLEHKKELLRSNSAYLEKIARNELYLSLTSDLLFSLKNNY